MDIAATSHQYDQSSGKTSSMQQQKKSSLLANRRLITYPLQKANGKKIGMQLGQQQKKNKQGATSMLLTNFAEEKSHKSLHASQRNSVTNREHLIRVKPKGNSDSNPQINFNIGSAASQNIDKNRVPAINMETVKKKSERQRLIHQMLQPGDQYGCDDQQPHHPGKSDLIQKPMKHQAARHTKLNSEMHGIDERQQVESNDLYGFSRTHQSAAEKQNQTPLIGRNSNKIQPESIPSLMLLNQHMHQKTRSGGLDSNANQAGLPVKAPTSFVSNITASMQMINEMSNEVVLSSEKPGIGGHQNKTCSKAATAKVGFMLEQINQNAPFSQLSPLNQSGIPQPRMQSMQHMLVAEDAQQVEAKMQFMAKQERFQNQLQELHTMGTEISRLQKENKRTKTSLQRMKSFHNQQKRSLQANTSANFKKMHESRRHQIDQQIHQQMNDYETGRYQRRADQTAASNTRLSKQHHFPQKSNSDRKIQTTAGVTGFKRNKFNQSPTNYDESPSDEEQLSEDAEFRERRKKIRNRNNTRGALNARNQRDRVSTAKGPTRKNQSSTAANAANNKIGKQKSNSRLFAQNNNHKSKRNEAPLSCEEDEMPPPQLMMKHTDSKIDLLFERLKQCQGDGGIVDPMQALKTMNAVQVEENPDAYVPNIEKQHRRMEEQRRMEKLYDEEYAKRYYDADKALFDFDESVDNLSQVSDRYNVVQAATTGTANENQPQQSNPVQSEAAIQGEELHSTEEQGKADEQALQVAQALAVREEKKKRRSKNAVKNLNSASVAILEQQLTGGDQKSRRSKSKKDLTHKLSRHKSDINMTPIGLGAKGLAEVAMRDLKRSKVSEDLKEEIIKDLANKKYRKDASRKFLNRNTSSQFSNYFERRMSNLAIGKLNNGSPAEDSARKAAISNEVSHLTNNAAGFLRTEQQKMTADEFALESKAIATQSQLRNVTEKSPVSRFAVRDGSASRKSLQKQPLLDAKNSASLRQSLNDYKGSSAKLDGPCSNLKPKKAPAKTTSGLLDQVHSSLIQKLLPGNSQSKADKKNKQYSQQQLTKPALTQSEFQPMQHQHQIHQRQQIEKQVATNGKHIKDLIMNMQSAARPVSGSKPPNSIVNPCRLNEIDENCGWSYTQKPLTSTAMEEHLMRTSIQSGGIKAAASTFTDFSQNRSNNLQNVRSSRPSYVAGSSNQPLIMALQTYPDSFNQLGHQAPALMTKQNSVKFPQAVQRSSVNRQSSNAPVSSQIDKMGFAMPLFQLENAKISSLAGLTGVVASCDQQRNQNNGLKYLNLAGGTGLHHQNTAHSNTTVNTRLNSSQKVSNKNENLHLSSALSEANFKQQKSTTAGGSRLLAAKQNNHLKITGNSSVATKHRNGSPALANSKLRLNKQKNSIQQIGINTATGTFTSLNSVATDKSHNNRVLSNHNAKPRAHPQKQSLQAEHKNASIGPQKHINRLKRFYCDNLDKQNVELAGKIQFVNGNFSEHLKNLVSDRLKSQRGSEATDVKQNDDCKKNYESDKTFST